MKKWLACLGLMMALAMPALAWQPSDWVYFNWPWAYDHATQDWYWLSGNNTQWAIRHASPEGWRRLNNSGLANGWSWHMWPYAYNHGNSAWYNFAKARNHWCINMRTGVWTVFGLPDAPAGMTAVPGGTNAGTDPDFGAYSLTTDPFYMDKHEVTKGRWDDVRTWALANGYDDLPAGDGKTAAHPVHTVTWFDCVKWCNALSEKEGRAPVYYVNAARTLVYKTGELVPYVKDAAGGRRMPTDDEWVYAARGGAAGRRFPWGTDTIQHARANYNSDVSLAYDTSATRGYHPSYDTNPTPYTSPVGSFAATGYGLYDMAGNVMEWCYDWHPDYVGSSRVLRGGSWAALARFSRVGNRNFNAPNTPHYSIGFRTVLRPQ
jgi:formylglycine-generating enzyme required for sulfatase activity